MDGSPATFAKSAKLKRQAAAKEKELAQCKSTKSKRSLSRKQAVESLRFVDYLDVSVPREIAGISSVIGGILCCE